MIKINPRYRAILSMLSVFTFFYGVSAAEKILDHGVVLDQLFQPKFRRFQIF